MLFAVNTLHVNLSIPVTAKFRVFPTVEKTVEYARMLERAGAQIITCHGRIREQRGQNTVRPFNTITRGLNRLLFFQGLADWDKIRAVKQAVSVPVFANGNILYQSDIDACLKATGADGVMSAEGQLYNPALFAGIDHPLTSPEYDSDAQILVRHPRHADLALEYLDVVRDLKTTTSVSGIKGHLFKIMRPGLGREVDLREKLGKVKINPRGVKEGLQAYVDVCLEMKERMDVCSISLLFAPLPLIYTFLLPFQRDAKAVEGTPLKDLITTEPITGIKVMSHWLAQPYFRPSPEQKKAYGKWWTSLFD